MIVDVVGEDSLYKADFLMINKNINVTKFSFQMCNENIGHDQQDLLNYKSFLNVIIQFV